MATAKQQVLELKVELEQAKATTWPVKEAAEATKQESYDLRVQETEVHLAKELAEVCKEYWQVTWTEAFNLARVLATLEWRKDENIYYPPDIHEVPVALPPPAALALTPSEQPLTTQASIWLA